MKKAVKLIAITLALLIAFTNSAFAISVPFAVSQPQAKMANGLGDVSGDGKISILDSAYVFFHILGLRKFDEAASAVADVNGDGKITFADMREITQYSFDRISVFSADTRYWTNCPNKSSHVASYGITTFDVRELEKDENGNNIYLYVEFLKNLGFTNSSSFSAKMSTIECNENPDKNIAIDMNIGKDNNRAYAEATIRQFQTYDFLNGFNFKVISENENVTFVLPQINSYVTDLGEGFVNIDDLTSAADNFKNVNIEKEYEYAQKYYCHSHYIERGGIEYICEVYREPYVIINNYFNTDGKLVRSETFKSYNTNSYSIMNLEYLGTDLDESMFDIPSLYIKISLENLKAFISENAGTQAYFDYITKKRS